MFKKRKKAEGKLYGTLEEVMTHLAQQFLKTEEAQIYYPNTKDPGVIIRAFSLHHAITENPKLFPVIPYIVKGKPSGQLYLIRTDKRGQRKQLGIIWNYEENGMELAPLGIF